MARLAQLSISGTLGGRSYIYEGISQAVGYFLNQKKRCQEAIAEGKDLYSWEYPPEIAVFTFNSNGGGTNGLSTACRSILSLSEAGIPTVGVVTGQACSAAYTLAAMCDLLIALPGSVLGSIAVASSWVDTSKEMEDLGHKAYFYSTHSGKVTGLPGENKSSEEIQAFLKESADATWEVLQDLLLQSRPQIAKEMEKLNGSAFTVKKGTSSSLFDLTASSLEEVIFTLNEVDMKNKSVLAKLFGQKMTTSSEVGSLSLTAGGKTSELTAQSIGEVLAAAGAAEEGKVENKASELKTFDYSALTSSIASAVVLALKSEFSETPETKAQTSAPEKPALLTELMISAKAHKVDDSIVAEVYKLELPKEKANQVMLLLAAKQDSTFTQSQKPTSMSNLESLAEPSKAEEQMSWLQSLANKANGITS